MSEQMPYADLIIMALVAGFILLRLRSVLGQKIGRDKPDDYRPARPDLDDMAEPVITFPDRMRARAQESEKAEDDASAHMAAEGGAPVHEDAKSGVVAIAAADAQFTPGSFLQGAKMAFEMVFDAFVKADKNTLKMLLSDAVYNEFSAAIDERKNTTTKTETTLVSVEKMQIEQAEKDKNIARVTVKFVSEQITVVRDGEGKIIEGDPSNVDNVEDEWVFERDVTSRNPNWKITAV